MEYFPEFEDPLAGKGLFDRRFDPFHVSPLALQPKKTPGEFRLLHNLSHPYDHTSVNAGIPQINRTVQYSSVGQAIREIQQLPRGSFASKSDISNTYKIIPIKPVHYPKLGIYFAV